MSYYAVPLYIGLSSLLCLSYSCMECVKEKGKLDSATHSILSCWVLISILVGSMISGVATQMMMGMTNYTFLLITLIIACSTLVFSSCLLSWT